MRAWWKVGLPVLALLTGAVAAWSRFPEASAKKDEGDGKQADGRSMEVRVQRTPGHSQGYRSAWDLLAARKMTAKERASLEKELLAQWAEVDVEGALAMAAAHPSAEDESIFNAFIVLMERDPEAFWPMIADGRFGMQGGDLRRVWIAQTGKTHPEVLLAHFNDLPDLSQQQAMKICGSNAAAEEGLRKVMAALEDSPAHRVMWKEMALALDGDGEAELFDRMSHDNRTGERWMAMDALAIRMACGGISEADLRARFDQIPDEMKHDAIATLLTRDYSQTQARMVADYLVEKGDWQGLDDALVERMGEPGVLGMLGIGSSDTPERLQWALKLPQREETAAIFRATVEPCVSVGRGILEKQIAAIPAGWQRDQALLSAVPNAVWRDQMKVGEESDAAARGVTPSADWVLGQIGDDKIRAEAKTLRDSKVEWWTKIREEK